MFLIIILSILCIAIWIVTKRMESLGQIVEEENNDSPKPYLSRKISRTIDFRNTPILEEETGKQNDDEVRTFSRVSHASTTISQVQKQDAIQQMFTKEQTNLTKASDKSFADTDICTEKSVKTEKTESQKDYIKNTRFETGSQVSSTMPAPELYRMANNDSNDRKREIMLSDIKRANDIRSLKRIEKFLDMVEKDGTGTERQQIYLLIFGSFGDSCEKMPRKKPFFERFVR